MKVLFFYQHFWPDSPPYANMLRAIGQRLVAEGHRVTVLTAQPSYRASDRRQKRPAREMLDGIEVRRLRGYGSLQRVGLFRTLVKALFPVRALLTLCLARLRGERHEVIVAATIPPVVNGLCAWLAARLTGARFVYHLQDIYPEIGAAGGLWAEGSWRHRLLLHMDRFVCRNADVCVALSGDMQRSLVHRGLSGDNVRVINNFMLTEFDGTPESDDPGEKGPQLVRRCGRHQVLFAGNLGRFQGLEQLVEAFLALDHERCDLALHFVGDGVMANTLRQRAEGCERIHFYGQVPFEQARRLIAHCDAGIVSIQPDVYRYAYPSKTLTYWGQGRPVLAVVESQSELAQAVRTHRLGVSTAGDNGRALQAGFVALAGFLDQEPEASERVQAYFQKHFATHVALDQWVACLAALPSKEALALSEHPPN